MMHGGCPENKSGAFAYLGIEHKTNFIPSSHHPVLRQVSTISLNLVWMHRNGEISVRRQ